MALPDMSDADVLQSVAEAGRQLLKSAQQMLAKLPPMKDDERWSAPIPLRFEVQLAVLFMDALDAYDITAGILRNRASASVTRNVCLAAPFEIALTAARTQAAVVSALSTIVTSSPTTCSIVPRRMG